MQTCARGQGRADHRFQQLLPRRLGDGRRPKATTNSAAAVPTGDCMRTLFLNPPSFEGFDGGASSRWPASREIESYWYPVWLCYPAGMLPDSKVVDAPPHKISIEQTVEMAQGFRTAGAVHLHSRFSRGRQDGGDDEGRQPEVEGGVRRAAGDHRAGEDAAHYHGHRFRGAPRVRPPDRRLRQGHAARGTARRQLPQERRRSSTTPKARPSRTWTRCPGSPRSTSAIWTSRATTSRSC